MTEKEIVEHIIHKDEHAFKSFFNDNIQLFYSIAHRLLIKTDATHEDIEDCIAESVIYIWYHLDQYDPKKCSFKNWCSLIIVNRTHNLIRKLHRHQRKLQFLDEQQKTYFSHELSAENQYLENQQMIQIWKKIDNIPSPSKEILLQKYIDGLSTKQIARNMSLPLHEINNHLKKAKRTLRKELSKNDTK